MKRVLRFCIVWFGLLLIGLASPAQQQAASGQSVGTATVGGGTTNFIPIWTSASKLGNSVIFQTVT